MNVVPYEQGSPEWLAARVGLVTASRVSDIIARTKTGWSTSRLNYLAQLVAERLTGVSAESGFMNDDMRRGVELEPFARDAYEVRTGRIVEQIGLVLHPTLRSGASPDGLVEEDGLLEVKCPRTHVHIDYLEGGVAPTAYRPQMTWQCICTERAWVDFVSFDPKMPERLRLFIVRFTPTEQDMANLTEEVAQFIGEVDRKIANLDRIAA